MLRKYYAFEYYEDGKLKCGSIIQVWFWQSPWMAWDRAEKIRPESFTMKIAGRIK